MNFEVKNGYLIRYTGNLKVINLVVPKGVRYIERGVFSPLKYLKKLVLPEGLWEIGERSMQDCVSLQEVNFPRSLQEIGKYAFEGCVNLEQITFSGDIRRLEVGSFQNCYSLREVTFTKECRLYLTLYKECFKGCLSLQEVHISAHTGDISEKAFEGCERLQRINIVGKNSRYADIDGVLTDAQKETLYIYPSGREEESYTIPESIHTIEQRAFRLHKKLKEVHIPANVQHIGDGAFFYCENLEKVVISNRVSDIDSIAFKGTKWLENHPDKFVIVGNGILLCYKGHEKEVIIPEETKLIKTSSFPYNHEIEKITIPASVRMIDENVFNACCVLKEIHLIHENGKVFTWNLQRIPSKNRMGGILTMLIQKNFDDFWGDIYVKYSCILDYFFDTEDKRAGEYLKEHFESFMKLFIYERDLFHLQRIIEEVGGLTAENIDTLIICAIDAVQKGGSLEVQMYLMDYKAKYLGYADPEDFFKL